MQKKRDALVENRPAAPAENAWRSRTAAPPAEQAWRRTTVQKPVLDADGQPKMGWRERKELKEQQSKALPGQPQQQSKALPEQQQQQSKAPPEQKQSERGEGVAKMGWRERKALKEQQQSPDGFETVRRK